MRVPSPGESITEVDLYNWLVKDGDFVEKDMEIAELDSAKATLTIVAEAAGVISFHAEEMDTLEVGALLCTIDTDANKALANDAPTDAPEVKADVQPQKTEAVAETHTEEVKPETVKAGLKPEQLVDELKHLSRSDAAMILKAAGLSMADAPQAAISRESNTEKMSALRRKLSERLVSVKNETAMLTTFNEVNMKPVLDLRKKYQEKFTKTHGVKLGLMSFFLKASAVALREFPNVNAMIDGDNITFFDYVDVSVAVSTPKGLMVPVIRNVESMSLAEIEQAIADVADKARAGKLTIPEMTGGTFTITNGGVFGSMMSTPIINPPQSAILGMHNITERAVVNDGEIAIRPMMYVALSYDHRVIDGRDSVSFLVRVKQLLENPVELLFGSRGGESQLLDL